jgi:hypothetical protein
VENSVGKRWTFEATLMIVQDDLTKCTKYSHKKPAQFPVIREEFYVRANSFQADILQPENIDFTGKTGIFQDK